MSNQDFARHSSPAEGHGIGGRTAKAAKEALSSATALASDAADKVKQTASDTAATVTGEVKQLLDRQVGGGAATVGHVARSLNRAAEELDGDAPQIAGLVRTFAKQVDGYANDLRGQSADNLLQGASDFTRRQPALVFGLAALAGFFVLRTLKSTPSESSSVPSPSIQPTTTSTRA
jgi:hypothetical protein